MTIAIHTVREVFSYPNPDYGYEVGRVAFVGRRSSYLQPRIYSVECSCHWASPHMDLPDAIDLFTQHAVDELMEPARRLFAEMLTRSSST